MPWLLSEHWLPGRLVPAFLVQPPLLDLETLRPDAAPHPSASFPDTPVSKLRMFKSVEATKLEHPYFPGNPLLSGLLGFAPAVAATQDTVPEAWPLLI